LRRGEANDRRFLRRGVSRHNTCFHNASVISSSALPPPENCEAFAHIVHLSRWGIHNSIAARGLGISVPQGGPWAFDTHVFESAMEEFISKDQAFIED